MYTDKISEACFIGALFQNPIEYVNYGIQIESTLDFSDDSLRFIYSKFEAYYLNYLSKSNVIEFSENQFDIMVYSDEKDKEKYDILGGKRFIKRLIATSDLKLINGYFDMLKKASLLRELEQKGFPVEKLMKHPKFDTLGVEEVEQIMQYNLSNIVTKVMKNKSAIDITQGMCELVEGYTKNPYLGTPFKFNRFTDLFMGMHAGDVMISFGFTNSGKSRKDISELADLIFIQNKKVLKLDNEMSAIKCKNALITTICNDKAYGFNLGIDERNIKLGIYKDDNEYKKVMEVARFVESYKDKWFFKHLSNFDDDVIKMEIKKVALSHNVDVLSYGTLKSMGNKQSDWSSLKSTVTMLKGLMEELQMFATLKAQLTMDSGKLSVFELDDSNIGESKGINQICDFSVIDKELSAKDIASVYYKKDGVNTALNPNVRWNGTKVLKNRDGAKLIMAQPYDLDKNMWGQYHDIYKI